MTALAVGAASAATTETTAGTQITNTASATFDVPGTNPGDPATSMTSTSNTVSTTVLPKPNYDIVFTSSTADSGTQNVLGTSTVVSTGVTPGSTISTNYSAVNTGNTPLQVLVAADTTGASTANGTEVVKYYDMAGVELPTTVVGGVTYYVINLPVDNPSTPGDEGVVAFQQRVTVPTTATPTDVYGASPEGMVVGSGTTLNPDGTVTGNGYTTGTSNYEQNLPVNTDLQFAQITMFTPTLDNAPLPTTPPANATGPDGAPYTAPSAAPVPVPTLAAGYTDPTLDTPPTQPVTGYTDPSGTPIVPNYTGDSQVAYPVADTNTTNDSVTFTNVVTSTQADTVQLFPVGAVNPDGSLAPGWTFDPATATFTNAATGTSVQFVYPGTTTPIPVDPGSIYPTLTVPAGGTVYYGTVITYPDSNDSAPITPITVTIGVDSLNDANVVADATTTDSIYPAAAQFGDTTGSSTDNAATPGNTPIQTVTPTGTYGSTTSPDVTDSTAVFPMDVVNNGTYSDSYKLSGTVDFNGTIVPVRYYDAATGLELPKDSAGNYITPVVAPGTEFKVLAVVDVPAGTLAGDYTVSQTAVGSYSTITMTDNNDIIRVAPLGDVQVGKFAPLTGTLAGTDPINGISNPADYSATQANGALPGSTIAYKIIGKNNYNTPVAKFALCDTVPANTTFTSVALSPAPSKTIYNVAGAGWSATAPAAGLAAGTSVCVAPDTNNDNVPDALAPGATLTADFVVTVK